MKKIINGQEYDLAPYANLSNANLSNADLFNVNLFNANLSNANLSNANLSNANLFNANLSKANLFKANLFKADLSNADLSNADLSYANLFNANLSKANLFKAIYQISQLLHNIQWGILSKDLTLESMRRDAIICGEEKMQDWINNNICPFNDNIKRDFYFNENKDIYISGKPQLNDLELFKALCKEKNITITI